jgi:hypothetical protein
MASTLYDGCNSVWKAPFDGDRMERQLGDFVGKRSGISHSHSVRPGFWLSCLTDWLPDDPSKGLIDFPQHHVRVFPPEVRVYV